MTDIIIIHGTGGSPKGNWFPWLKSKLEELGCRVFVPKFPTPENQSLDNWLKVFQDYGASHKFLGKNFEKYLGKNSIVVGHSLGPAFLLSILERLKSPIKAAFFVSGFTGLLSNPEFDEPNRTFTTKSFNWDRVKENCRKFYVINSDNDPYVPFEKGKELAKNLDTELIILKNAGHINQEAGYDKFDFLLKKMKNEL